LPAQAGNPAYVTGADDDADREDDASALPLPAMPAYISRMPDPSIKPCPICGKPANPSTRPFCSRRCADVDLHRWLSGVYGVPAVEGEEDDLDKDAGEKDAR
jgi:endogenous inhibitor of DNA gyrase (YacG/DUF329 family)